MQATRQTAGRMPAAMNAIGGQMEAVGPMKGMARATARLATRTTRACRPAKPAIASTKSAQWETAGRRVSSEEDAACPNVSVSAPLRSG